MKKKDLIITIIFIFSLILPNILYWVFYDKMDHTNYENRNLYEKPLLQFNNITEFPSAYENYYNDNIPFKNEIRNLYSKILYSKLNMSSNAQVIVGENGWLFYNSVPDGDSINDYRKIYNYSEEIKKKIKDKLEENSKKLKQDNIKFYVIIPPNKEAVYSEYMPNMILINENNEYSRTEDLVNYLLDESDLNIIYPKQSLIEGKKIADTYFKYDTHWNSYGAYIGTMELMKLMNPKFELPQITIGKNYFSGDLANMILLSNNISNEEPVVENFYNEIEVVCSNDELAQICTSSKGIYKKKILVIGDSFSEGMIQYLSKIYRNSVFVHRNYYNESLMDKYKPDIVVYEVVERYSYFLDYLEVLVVK